MKLSEIESTIFSTHIREISEYLQLTPVAKSINSISDL